MDPEYKAIGVYIINISPNLLTKDLITGLSKFGKIGNAAIFGGNNYKYYFGYVDFDEPGCAKKCMDQLMSSDKEMNFLNVGQGKMHRTFLRYKWKKNEEHQEVSGIVNRDNQSTNFNNNNNNNNVTSNMNSSTSTSNQNSASQSSSQYSFAYNTKEMSQNSFIRRSNNIDNQSNMSSSSLQTAKCVTDFSNSNNNTNGNRNQHQHQHQHHSHNYNHNGQTILQNSSSSISKNIINSTSSLGSIQSNNDLYNPNTSAIGGSTGIGGIGNVNSIVGVGNSNINLGNPNALGMNMNNMNMGIGMGLNMGMGMGINMNSGATMNGNSKIPYNNKYSTNNWNNWNTPPQSQTPSQQQQTIPLSLQPSSSINSSTTLPPTSTTLSPISNNRMNVRGGGISGRGGRGGGLSHRTSNRNMQNSRNYSSNLNSGIYIPQQQQQSSSIELTAASKGMDVTAKEFLPKSLELINNVNNVNNNNNNNNSSSNNSNNSNNNSNDSKIDNNNTKNESKNNETLNSNISTTETTSATTTTTTSANKKTTTTTSTSSSTSNNNNQNNNATNNSNNNDNNNTSYELNNNKSDSENSNNKMKISVSSSSSSQKLMGGMSESSLYGYNSSVGDDNSTLIGKNDSNNSSSNCSNCSHEENGLKETHEQYYENGNEKSNENSYCTVYEEKNETDSSSSSSNKINNETNNNNKSSEKDGNNKSNADNTNNNTNNINNNNNTNSNNNNINNTNNNQNNNRSQYSHQHKSSSKKTSTSSFKSSLKKKLSNISTKKNLLSKTSLSSFGDDLTLSEIPTKIEWGDTKDVSPNPYLSGEEDNTYTNDNNIRNSNINQNDNDSSIINGENNGGEYIRKQFTRTKLNISRIPPEMTNDQLYQLFLEHGNILNMTVKPAKIGTVAFLEYATPNEAMEAVRELDDAYAIVNQDDDFIQNQIPQNLDSLCVDFAYSDGITRHHRQGVTPIYIKGLPISMKRGDLKIICVEFGDLAKTRLSKVENVHGMKCSATIEYVRRDSVALALNHLADLFHMSGYPTVKVEKFNSQRNSYKPHV